MIIQINWITIDYGLNKQAVAGPFFLPVKHSFSRVYTTCNSTAHKQVFTWFVIVYPFTLPIAVLIQLIDSL